MVILKLALEVCLELTFATLTKNFAYGFGSRKIEILELEMQKNSNSKNGNLKVGDTLLNPNLLKTSFCKEMIP